MWLCVCICLFVCECLTAITHVALLRLVTESTYERAAERAPPKRASAQNAGSFFLRSLLLFFKFFSFASFLAFSLQRFKYRISRVSDYSEYDNTRLTTWCCCCCKSKNFYNFRIWSPMTSYPILWSGLWTDCVAISTSVHTFVRTYV